jgi:hypothetical protein
MAPVNEMRAPSAGRSNVVTAAAVGLLAFAAVDLAHEGLGHGGASLFIDGVTPVLLSTVALSTQGTSRAVAAAGPLLNLILGIACLWAFRRGKGFGPATCFLWLFATLNLFNGLGYAIYSGVLDFGDLAVVIHGWDHHIAWRVGMVAIGGAGYYLAALTSASSLWRRLHEAERNPSDIARVTVPAYLAGSSLLLAGAALNPIPGLILLSGASSGFACMSGLLLLPSMLPESGAVPNICLPILGDSWPWLMAAIAASVIFLWVFGPGIGLR